MPRDFDREEGDEEVSIDKLRKHHVGDDVGDTDVEDFKEDSDDEDDDDIDTSFMDAESL